MPDSGRKAIVLGCRDVGLGVIRALSAKNVNVMAIPDGVFDFAHFSRFAAAKTKMMSPGEGEKELLDFLLALDTKWDRALILPTNDPTALFIAKNNKALSSRFVVAAQDWDAMDTIINKARLYRQARKIGVPMPEVFLPDSVESLIHRKDELNYPCILKPYETHKFFPVFHVKSFFIRNSDELLDKFIMVKNNNLSVMVSEIIPGADDCIYNYVSYIDTNGAVLTDVLMQKVRQHPPGFGMARVAKTVAMIHEIRSLAGELLKSLSYQGFSSVELKYDERDNCYKLMEINVRAELQERLFLAAGINFPYMIYLDAVEGIKSVPRPYQPDIYWIDFTRDLYSSLRCRKAENWSFADYLRPYFGEKVFCTPFFDDPLPFVMKNLIVIQRKLAGIHRRRLRQSPS